MAAAPTNIRHPVAKPKKSKTDVDQFDWRLVKALSHPTRAHALMVCTHRPASPKEIAAELGVNINHVYYHVKELVKLECVELVETKKRRAVDEHFYKATVRHYFSPEDWKKVPRHKRMSLRVELMKTVSGDASTAARGETLDSGGNHMSRVALQVDSQGWREISERLDEALEDVMQIKSSAAVRLGQSDERGIETRVSLLHFEFPTAPEAKEN
jgi:predicted ArsR family transcriptional regulator